MKLAAVDQQKAFIEEVLFSNALSAAFQRSTTYRKDEDFSSKQKDALRETLKSFLRSTVNDPLYVAGSVSDSQHRSKIIELADAVSSQHANLLEGEKFRIGSAQKILNLYLKFHWCMGKIAEPPHCPLDRIVIERLAKKYHTHKWTKLDSIGDYQLLIDALRELATRGGCSIAQWELQAYETQYRAPSTS